MSEVKRASAPFLTPAQIERLVLLWEELNEAGMAVGKILRHGYNSYNPLNPNVVIDHHGVAFPCNQDDLETELGHVLNAIAYLVQKGDLINSNVHAAKEKKYDTMVKYLHHFGEV